MNLRPLMLAGMLTAVTTPMPEVSAAASIASTESIMSIASSGAVEEFSMDWRDAARQRTIPVKWYLPAVRPGAAVTPVPVVLFSHGLGGSRDGYEFLGRYWAEHGLAVVHLQHPGSDESVWRGKGLGALVDLRLAANLEQARARIEDVAFAVAELKRLVREDPRFRGRLDLERIGIAGHSFGANTSLWTAAVAGGFPVPGVPVLPEIKAAVILSPAPVGPDAVYRSIRIPCLHMTGTEDHSPIRDVTPAQRLEPYERIAGVPEYLVIFTGGDHMVFSGRAGTGSQPAKRRELDARLQPAIQQTSLAFLQAFLLEDKPARAWLDGQGAASLAGLIGPLGECRRKAP